MRPRRAPLLILSACALVGCSRARAPSGPTAPDRLAELVALLEAPEPPPRPLPPRGDAAPARHGRAEAMLASSNDGRWGYLLAEVGGTARFARAEAELFEPASTLKAVYLLHALRAVDAGTVTLRSPVGWFRASTVADDPSTPGEDEREYGCPLDADPAVGELGEGLRLMMERSDNRWTLAVRRLFGDDAVRATAREAGMERTVLAHRIGCAGAVGGDPGALDAPDASTLAELCGMLRAVAAGTLLSPDLTRAFFDLMANDPFVRLEAIVREEGAALGLPETLLTAVARRQELAWKSGKYNIGAYKCQSVAGFARVVSYAAGELRSRELVFGVFVDDAREFPEQGTRATLYSLAVASELLRGEVREALASFRAALDT